MFLSRFDDQASPWSFLQAVTVLSNGYIVVAFFVQQPDDQNASWPFLKTPFPKNIAQFTGATQAPEASQFLP